MLAKKKKDPPIAPDCDFGTVNTTRIFNVRQPGHEGWHFKVLYDTNSVPFDDEHDGLDKNHKLFFDCVIPESNNDILLGSEEEPLDPDVSFEALSAVHDMPRIKYSILPRNEMELVTPKEEFHISLPNTVIDVIELSDDDEITVVEEVKKTKQWKISNTIVQQRLTRNMEKLSSFLRNMGIENTKTEEIQKNQLDYGSCTSNLLSDLDGHYLAVNSGKYPRKTKFMMIPAGMKQKGISKLIDSPVKKVKAVKKEEKKSKKTKETPKKASKQKSIKIRKRIRSPSPIFVQYSSDDDDNHIKNGIESIMKKELPSEGSKQVPIWKKKADQDSSNVSSLPAHETFVPRKEAKLRTTNVNDLLRNNESDRKEAERQKEKLARAERERREKEEELKKNKNEELPRVVAKFKIPRKEGVIPPSDKSPDISEPTKKKIRSDVPACMSSIDILGDITEAMNAGAKVNETAVRLGSPEDGYVWKIG
ncbi:hypothetical protein PRIPAC_71637 [Pristionchus pacificus]|uniref:Uncharacterized protein n=1 Tax=Pristionchus pacificus TaxID=54126 RepID=A0A2A6CS70_PRIPA|nr:hypothetical protein PRIPAC_71637 [Pristionchus pacificus]|eukprot:PDM81045.1 hypothetical protein PRIPAC_36048 [Pristionchus pacificus]